MRSLLFRAVFTGALLVALSPALRAQHAFWIPYDASGSTMTKLVDFRDGRLVVDVGGSRETIVRPRYYIRDAFEFATGQVLANQPKATIYDADSYQEFEFRMLVKPDRDYDNVYAVIHLNTVEGQSVFLPQELNAMKAGRPQWLHFRGTLSLKLDRGVFNVYLFSNGVELYQVPTDAKLKGKKQPPIPARSRGSQDPVVVVLPEKPLPRPLAAAVANGAATFSFMVADSGYGYDFRALDAASELVEAAALSLLKASRYIPGAEDGFFVAKPMVVRIDFDARGGYRFESPTSGERDEDFGF